MNEAPSFPRKMFRRRFRSVLVEAEPGRQIGNSWTLSAVFSNHLRGLQRPIWIAYVSRDDLDPESIDADDLGVMLLDLGLVPDQPSIVLVDRRTDYVHLATEFPLWICEEAELFLEGMHTEGSEYLKQWLLRHIPIADLNPYQSDLPTSEEMFFGRESEISSLITREGSFVIFGPRRVGKTSVAHQTTRLLQRDPNFQLSLRESRDRDRYLSIAAYIDVASLIDPDQLWITFLRAMGLEERDLYHPRRLRTVLRSSFDATSDFEILQNLLRFKYKQAIFILDEVDWLIEREQTTNWSVLTKIRSLVEDSRARMRVILVGYERLLNATTDVSFPLYGRPSTITLGGLEKDAVWRLVLEPMQELGFSFESNEKCVDLIDDATGGLPNLIQDLCRLLVVEHNPRKRIDSTFLEAFLKAKRDNLSQTLYGSFQKGLGSLARLLAYDAVSTRKIHLHESLNRINRLYGLNVSEVSVRSASATLCIHNVFREESVNEFTFTNKLLRERLKTDLATQDGEALLHSLGREIERASSVTPQAGLMEPLVIPRTYGTVFSLHGDNPRVNIASIDESVNLLRVKAREIVTEVHQAIETQVGDESERRKLFDALEALQSSVGKPTLVARYREFMGLAAQHAAVLGPFLPALAKLLG